MRCIGPDGNMIGVLSLRDALKVANDNNMDLVEISPNADPPVCRVMDFGKFKYEESIKEKQARKHQHKVVIKEIKFHVNVGEHDLQTKLNHVKEFLEKGHKVKLSLTFFGRENLHRELGFELMTRVLKECEPVCQVENSPRIMGSTILAMIGPKTKGG